MNIFLLIIAVIVLATYLFYDAECDKEQAEIERKQESRQETLSRINADKLERAKRIIRNRQTVIDIEMKEIKE